MISYHSITDLTSVGRNSTRCGYVTVEQCGKISKKETPGETEFGVAGSDVGFETNGKRIGKVSLLKNTSLPHNFLMS